MSLLSKSFKIDFTQVPNGIINDKRVSLKAKGLYLYFVSKPDNWDFTLNGMASQLKEVKSSIISVIDELCKFGYMEKVSRRDEKGRQMPNDYILHVKPLETPYSSTESKKQSRKNRVGKTESVNHTTSNTNKSNKDKLILSKGRFALRVRDHKKSFSDFRKDFINSNIGELFYTVGLGWLPDTAFTISPDGYILNTVSQKYVDKDDAFKIWSYLYNQYLEKNN